MLIPHLEAELQRLKRLEDQVRNSGPVAPPYTFLTKTSSKGVTYARLVEQRKAGEKQKVQSLGRPGSDRHLDWQARIQRREALAEIAQQAALIRELIDRQQNRAIIIPQQPNETAA